MAERLALQLTAKAYVPDVRYERRFKQMLLCVQQKRLRNMP
ncbi:MAG TPA: hypothetical protein VJL89_01205 [Thermodesulfovibrionia bacterium]|nr:hypothetical protein [Thermodesulfovibrionia bacterium]